MLRPALQLVSIRKYSRLPTRRPDHPPILPYSYQRMAKGGAPQHNTSARGGERHSSLATVQTVTKEPVP